MQSSKGREHTWHKLKMFEKQKEGQHGSCTLQMRGREVSEIGEVGTGQILEQTGGSWRTWQEFGLCCGYNGKP